MMKTKLFSVSLAAMVAFTGSAIVSLPAAENDGASRRAAMLQQAKEKLGLTDEQTEKIKSELSSEKEAIVELMQRMQAAKAELRDTLQRTNATETEVRGAATKVGAVEVDAAVLKFKLTKKIMPILTAEQVDKLKELNASVDQFITKVIETVGAKLQRQ